MTSTRRQVLAATGAVAVAGAASAGAAGAATSPVVGDPAWLQQVLERYAGFGIKASGGAGDEACGAWLAGELTRVGYACEQHHFEVPFFEPTAATLTSGDARADVIPQAVVRPTGPKGVTAPLRLAERPGDLTGAIALVSLPSKRWIALGERDAVPLLADAFGRGAVAAVAITNGPSGEAIALNVAPEKPGFDRPVVLLAPKDAPPFLAAAAGGGTATLTVDGRGGRRRAHNMIAKLDRRAEKTLILSTPRSGWFTCAAERGSGLAAWFGAAHWLAAQPHRLNLEVVATSGHEYDYLGGERYVAERAPPPGKTKLWAYIGASFAARDWQEAGGELRPLATVDPQRSVTATADIIEPVRRAFNGLSGLEAVRLATGNTAGGELKAVIEAGYPSAMGESGLHRYFHTRNDDMRCVSGDLVHPAAEAFKAAIAASI
ncbi:hypothetical protein [Phenylobacterium sp.]|uniref:hypothetical protein n=1 Tax=Phenylobacterium sp. TaxID=1871053 RepID=UPI0025E4C75D|nr:hypothetical protein [Phenylobacterium sp.]MBX3484900.1 hypothetical protein [Phenylobacterium sp.]MCW5759303.1 hypothetical protein [Phenylobacterium sp.]